MLVVDACVWIETLQETATAKRYTKLWNRLDKIIVPVPVQFEIYRWCLRNTSRDVAIEAISSTRRCIVQPLTESEALLAATLAIMHKLAALDAMIYAQAQIAQATLVTCDAHFEGLPGVDYQPKLAA